MFGRIGAEKAVFAIIVAVLAIVTLFFGYTGYSLHGFLDAGGTMPPAINYALNGSFSNPTTVLRNAFGDPTGQGRFLWFPPLLSLVVSRFINPASSLPPPQQALLADGILAAIATLLAAFFFYKVATLAGKKFDFFAVGLISAIMAIIIRSMWNQMGRPEVLESIFILAGFFLALYVEKPKFLIPGFAILLGIVGAAHPVGAYVLACSVGIYFAFHCDWQHTIAYTIITGLLGWCAFLLVMQWSPYSIMDTLAGLANYGSHEFIQRIGFHFSLALIPHGRYAILYGIMMLITIACCVHLYRHLRPRITSKFLFIVFVLLMAALLAYVVVIDQKTYYALLFSFLIFAVIIYYLTHVVRAKFIKYGALLFAGIFGIISLQPLLVFPFFLKDGTGIAQARTEFAPIAARWHNTNNIFFSGDLWVLSENYAGMRNLGDFDIGDGLKRPLVIILDQKYSYDQWNPGPTPPATAEGCPLEENNFVSKVPSLFGHALTNAMPGYGFAVYACDSNTSSSSASGAPSNL